MRLYMPTYNSTPVIDVKHDGTRTALSCCVTFTYRRAGTDSLRAVASKKQPKTNFQVQGDPGVVAINLAGRPVWACIMINDASVNHSIKHSITGIAVRGARHLLGNVGEAGPPTPDRPPDVFKQPLIT